MAGRERRRREEHRKSREKEKESEKAKELLDENNSQANGARRSGRNNGQQPELSITDPVQLERRLKRQRSNEAASDSHASEEEKENGENREAKRSRITDFDDDERDPLDIVSPTPLPQPRVHFAPEIEPMQMPEETNAQHDTDMVVDDSPRRQSGFNPSLLNPMPSPEVEHNPFYTGTPSTLNLNGALSSLSAIANPPSPLPNQPANSLASSEPMSTSMPSPLQEVPSSHAKSPDAPTLPSSPAPMVVERSPTPLPDFHADEGLVAELQRRLRDNTTSLTIEELEQLRATCLGNVWRHRSEWNRDALVQELLDVVQEFVSEVTFSQ